MRIHVSYFVWLRLTFCAVSNAALGQATVPLPTGAVLAIGAERWSFEPRHTESGIAVTVRKGAERHEFVLDFSGSLGDVIGIVGNGGVVILDGRASIALGVASLARDGNAIEYRLLYTSSHGNRWRSERGWIFSEPLIVRPVGQAFHSMSIGLLGGDSIMLALQRVVRSDMNTDLIERHTFINHCPTGDKERAMFDKVIWHYESLDRGRSGPDGAPTQRVLERVQKPGGRS